MNTGLYFLAGWFVGFFSFFFFPEKAKMHPSNLGRSECWQ